MPVPVKIPSPLRPFAGGQSVLQIEATSVADLLAALASSHKELATRLPDVLTEVPVDVVYQSFTKRYFADVIVRGSGLFEFKAADAIHPKHRGQCIHYLFLFDLGHGKIVNVRTGRDQYRGL